MTRKALHLMTEKALHLGRARAMVLTTSMLLLVLPASAGIGQVPQVPPPPGLNRPPRPGEVPSATDSPSTPNPAKLEHMREDDRRKRLLADTAKLLTLSTELKEEVEKSSKDELSLEVVRKAAEIEKLARDVKERMKG